MTPLYGIIVAPRDYTIVQDMVKQEGFKPETAPRILAHPAVRSPEVFVCKTYADFANKLIELDKILLAMHALPP